MNPANTYVKRLVIFMVCVLIALAIGALCINGSTTNLAEKRGATEAELTALQPKEIAQYANKSPDASEPPATVTDKAFYLYRFSCEDCHEIYPIIKDALPDDIYAISTRSEYGTQFVEKYQITAVPTGVIFTGNSPTQYDLTNELERTQFISDLKSR